MKNLYIDFDGVILDTITNLDIMIENNNIDVSTKDKRTEFYQSVDWDKLLVETKQLNDSIECIEKIIASNMFNISILTHVNSLHEAMAKINYIRSYFEDITIIPVPRSISKTKLVQTKNAILIDDYSKNLEEWELEGGIAIRFNLELEDKGYIVINRLDKILEIVSNI